MTGFYEHLRQYCQQTCLSQSAWEAGQFFLLLPAGGAFGVSLRQEGGGVRAVFGYAPHADARDREFFSGHGIPDLCCPLRAGAFLTSPEDVDPATGLGIDCFHAWAELSSAEAMALQAEKRKAFLRRLSYALRPEGTSKRGADWHFTGSDLLLHGGYVPHRDRFRFAFAHAQRESSPVVFRGETDVDWQVLTHPERAELFRCLRETAQSLK